MSVGGVCSGSTKAFSREEEEALRRDESTSAIMNRVRRDAGGTGDVALRGDDKTRAEVAREQKEHVGANGAIEIGKGVLIEAPHFIEGVDGALGGAGVIAGALTALPQYALHVIELEHQKEELKNAITRDELHVTLLTQLDLPKGYKDIAVRKRPDAGQGWQSEAQKMTTQLATKDKALVATLQLHADRGMHGALDLRASGTTKDAFLAANPKVMDAYASDAAFREGFDAIVWAQGADFEDAKAKLFARDARYACTGVSVRV